MRKFLLLMMKAVLCCAAVVSGAGVPKYVWPLGNSTVYREVMSGRDAHLPDSNQCFVFSQGPPGLPYTALTLSGEDNSFVDFYLNGRTEFTDLALSLYIYPDGNPEGTILNYLCETGNVIKLSVLQTLLFVSFWDEYGVSVGVTAIPELLEADTWNHLVVSRKYDSGRIKVYHNGELVDDIDDDFPNKISLPIKGSIRLGSSQKEEEEVNFKGRFACFQFFTGVDVMGGAKYCHPDNWRILPEMNLETKTVDGVEKECVTDYVTPSEEGDAEPKECDVIDMACINSGVNWNWLLRKNQWTASNRDSAHFHLITRDSVPAEDKSVLSDVMVDDRTMCPRLCLRVEGCLAFSSDLPQANSTRCVMYTALLDADQPRDGAVYFSLT